MRNLKSTFRKARILLSSMLNLNLTKAALMSGIDAKIFVKITNKNEGSEREILIIAT